MGINSEWHPGRHSKRSPYFPALFYIYINYIKIVLFKIILSAINLLPVIGRSKTWVTENRTRNDFMQVFIFLAILVGPLPRNLACLWNKIGQSQKKESKKCRESRVHHSLWGVTDFCIRWASRHFLTLPRGRCPMTQWIHIIKKKWAHIAMKFLVCGKPVTTPEFQVWPMA